jgi:hypothetical protein
MGSRIWLNHAGHLCQGCQECACGAYPGATSRNRLARQHKSLEFSLEFAAAV